MVSSQPSSSRSALADPSVAATAPAPDGFRRPAAFGRHFDRSSTPTSTARVKRFQARHGLPARRRHRRIHAEGHQHSGRPPASASCRPISCACSAMSGDLGQPLRDGQHPGCLHRSCGERPRRAAPHRHRRQDRPPVADPQFKIYEVILNPYWTAPRSIVQKDIMPLMRKDPTYLKRNNIRLFDGKRWRSRRQKRSTGMPRRRRT